MLDYTYSIGHPYSRSILDAVHAERLKFPNGNGCAVTDNAREMQKLI